MSSVRSFQKREKKMIHGSKRSAIVLLTSGEGDGDPESG
jgi:hypothetical protein